MHRRTLLVGLAAIAGAGCVGRGSPEDTDTPAGDDPGDSPMTDDPFADVPCPAVRERADRHVCYHTLADPETAPLVLSPGRQRVDWGAAAEVVEPLTFTLHNRTGAEVGFNWYDWAIHRRTDEGWTRVAPEMIPEPWTSIAADETYVWSLADTEHDPPREDRAHTVVQSLDAGTYAFSVDVQAETGGSTERVACVALFDVR
jgi:hypothetical protein